MIQIGEQCFPHTPRTEIEKCCEICCQRNEKLNITKNDSLPIAQANLAQSGFTAVAIGKKQTGDVGELVIFHEVTTNMNNHFSLATNVFTCRYPGVYFFTFTIGVATNADPIIGLMKNGQKIVASATRTGEEPNNLSQSGNSTLLDLQAGDQVWLQFLNGGTQVYIAGKYTSFTGYLLYAKEQTT